MPARLDAVVFDLDGVITDTARVHARAWKKAFDDFLHVESSATGTAPFVPFDEEHDYLTFVDGKPRLDGARSFLQSRGYGDATVDVEAHVAAICKAKNARFADILETDGVARFESTVALVSVLLAAGVRVGIATSSRNADRVLQAAGLAGAFASLVDGRVATDMGLRGKPAPDIFLECCDRLGAIPANAAVVEDAVAGVAAARAGQFGLVVGVDRARSGDSLRAGGAHVVVNDLSEMSYERLVREHATHVKAPA